MRFNHLMSAILMLPAALGIVEQAGAAQPAGKAVLDVEFGAPTFIQRLHYRKMYEKKPYPDAILLYYANGLYKILSPGEEHYGSYVVEGDVKGESYTVHYVSLPSADWSGASAYHVLRFDNRERGFIQNAVVPVDGRLPQQHGEFVSAANDVADPRALDWEKAQHMIAAPTPR